MLPTDFDFHLPPELIAQAAVSRGESRLLLLDRASGTTEHRSFADLPRLLRAGDVLVLNNTRVFAARLLGHRVPSGGAVECLLLERADASGATDAASPPAASEDGERWTALMHPGQKLKPGSLVRFQDASGRALMGEVLERHFHGRRTIRLWSEDGAPVSSLVDALGHVPLPPYIHRPDTADDRERYQTVFARVRGSVAAPTAGLHFTTSLIDDLRAHGVEPVEVTLHVGYGTFKPITAERVADHVVDPESYEIPQETATRIARARAEGRRVIAVGTTTTRALEDAARRGDGVVCAGAGRAEIFIYPGHTFQVIDGLITNFHLPKSSLLMLVCALAGTAPVLRAYQEAIERRYRFYSYGDAMLVI